MSRFLVPTTGLVLSLFILVPTGRAEDLTSPQHELKSNRSTSSIVRSGGTATLPFDITVTNERVGERYAGSVEVSFPEKISGSVDGTGTFLLVSPAVKGTVKLKFLYTTRTSDPADTTYPYALSGALYDHAFPNVNYCEGPQIIERVGAGVYEINYSLEGSKIWKSRYGVMSPHVTLPVESIAYR